MALTKEDIADLAKVFAAALQAQAATPPPPDPDSARRVAAHNAKRKDLTERTHKTKTHARYRLGQAAYIAGQGMLPAGTLVTVPVKHVPSHTWVPVDAKGVALDPMPKDDDDLSPEADEDIEAEAADDVEPDEVDEEPEEVDEEPEAKPVKAGKPAAKPAAKAPTKPGKARASDKDVA